MSEFKNNPFAKMKGNDNQQLNKNKTSNSSNIEDYHKNTYQNQIPNQNNYNQQNYQYESHKQRINQQGQTSQGYTSQGFHHQTNNNQNNYYNPYSSNAPIQQNHSTHNPMGSNNQSNQSQFHQHQMNMYQANQFGQQLKQNKKGFNIKKIIPLLILGIPIILGIFMIFNLTSNNEDVANGGSELTIDEQILLNLNAKIDDVSKNGTDKEKKFLVYFYSLYSEIFSETKDELGYNPLINTFNIDLALELESIEQLEGKELQAATTNFNNIIKRKQKEIKDIKILFKDTFLNGVAKQLALDATTKAEIKAINEFISGLKLYISFLDAYENYLKNPTTENVKISNERQVTAVAKLKESMILYVIIKE